MGWLTNVENSVANFVKTEWAKITGDAVVVETALETAAQIGINLVTGLKTWLASPQGQEIEQVISNIPGIGPYVTDVLNFLPQLMIDLNWAVAEFSKSPKQIVIDGITKAVNAATPNVKATNLATLAAHVTTYVSTLAQAPQSIQSALSATPAVYAGVTPLPIVA